MPLAASTYTFGDGLITVLWLAFLFLWIWIAIGVVFDIFRSHDLSNWAKALWVLFIFVFPLIGVVGYLIVRGHTLHEHQAQDHAQYEAFRQFTRGSNARRPRFSGKDVRYCRSGGRDVRHRRGEIEVLVDGRCRRRRVAGCSDVSRECCGRLALLRP
jgi:hypothetical protein